MELIHRIEAVSIYARTTTAAIQTANILSDDIILLITTDYTHM